MRILYHHRTQADGAEGVHIAEMIRAFRALGHDVRLIGPAPREEPGSPSAAGRVKGLLPAAMFEAVACVWNIPEYLGVRRAIRDFQPDFVYARHARFGVGAVLAALHRGVPLALEVNCLFADPQYQQFEPLHLRRLAFRLERCAVRAASLVMPVSSPLGERLRALGCTAVKVLPNGVDPVKFDSALADRNGVRARLGLRDAVVVGWAGILRPWHGLDVLLDAIAQVDGVALLLVGDGPARPDLERRAAVLGIADRVIVSGRVPHSAMRDYIAAMDIAVVANERTGMASPMKLLEYMAMGRAVVAPDLPNIRDVVRTDYEGVLFDVDSTAALSSVLRRLRGLPDSRERLGQLARLKVTTERNWMANAQAVVTAISGAPLPAVPRRDEKG